MARRGLRATAVRGWLAVGALAVGVALVPVPEWVVDEIYSRRLYPVVQRAMTTMSNAVPLAVLDVMIVLALGAVLWRTARLSRTWRDHGAVAAVSDGVRRVIRAAAVLVVVFLLAWGLNYRRVPLEATIGSLPAPLTAALQDAIADADALAVRVRPASPAPPELEYAGIAIDLPAAMNTALAALGRPPLAQPGRPKFSLILGPFFTAAGVSGMINPFALESLVDPGLLPIERPFVLAHEWAHLAGHADEAEANAVAWLACMKGTPAMAYSANLYLITEAAGRLPSAARRSALARLAESVRGDLTLIANRVLQQQRPRVQQTAFRVYDGYLRANQVPDGTASYGRALTLILSARFRAALDDYRVPAGTPGRRPIG